MNKHIKISNLALNYLKNLIKKENNNNLFLYLSSVYKLTKDASISIIYCTKNDIDKRDIKLEINNLVIYINYESIIDLKDAIIDIKNNELCVKLQNILIKNNNKNLKEKIQNLFEKEINVTLSQHGGYIELINIENNNILIIKFHGGCQGCSMVNSTLNDYIENLIKLKFPKIKEIKDITSHEVKYNAYY